LLRLGFCAGSAWAAAVFVDFGVDERCNIFARVGTQLAVIFCQPLLNALFYSPALGIKSTVGKERL
jgi:hypothetical protein